MRVTGDSHGIVGVPIGTGRLFCDRPGSGPLIGSVIDTQIPQIPVPGAAREWGPPGRVGQIWIWQLAESIPVTLRCLSGVENPFGFNSTYIFILVEVSSTGRDILTQKSLLNALRHQNATYPSGGIDVPTTKCKMYVAFFRRVDLGRIDALIALPEHSANLES